MTTYTNDQATLIAEAIGYGWFNGRDNDTGEDVRAGIGLIIAGPVMIDGVEIGAAEYRVCIPLTSVVATIAGLTECLAQAVNRTPAAGEPAGPIPDPRAIADDSMAPLWEPAHDCQAAGACRRDLRCPHIANCTRIAEGRTPDA